MNNVEFRPVLDWLHERYLKAFYEWQDGKLEQRAFDVFAAENAMARDFVLAQGKGWARGYKS